jgi:predicted HTH transcriptional regulator
MLLGRGTVVAEGDLLFDADLDEAAAPTTAPKKTAPASTLTERQERILEKARARGSTGVSEVMQEESVSRATAHRDLSELVTLGKLTTTGKAALTRYLPAP